MVLPILVPCSLGGTPSFKFFIFCSTFECCSAQNFFTLHYKWRAHSYAKALKFVYFSIVINLFYGLRDFNKLSYIIINLYNISHLVIASFLSYLRQLLKFMKIVV
ncbi:hypothetical protein [Campylobacter concisus]|uniref:hypothetical protein n=1 Tax=Campylobacter concisus TaxID=199 RepID=UPI0021564DDC|nr:hypothetical protein [Campylobacter concisus]